MARMLQDVRPFFQDAEAQLGSTHHFGILGSLLSSQGELTRRTYVERQCDLLFRVKEAGIGPGLGSANAFPRNESGRDDYGPVSEWTGLAVCQAWTILLNAGHLFGTFATERGLLFRLDRELIDREDFVRACIEFDLTQGNRLRPVVERALNEARLHSFHYLLSLWRLRDGGLSQLGSGDRHIARLLLKAFLNPPSEKVKRWVDVFRRVRQLTYLSLHRAVTGAKYTLTLQILGGLRGESRRKCRDSRTQLRMRKV